MKTAVMLVDLFERDRNALGLPYIKNLSQSPFDDLIKLLDYSDINDLPIIITTQKLVMQTDHLCEIKNHPIYRKANIFDKYGLAAFSNLELDIYLKELGIRNIILGGYHLALCVRATAGNGMDLGYSTISAKTILYNSISDNKFSKDELASTAEKYFTRLYNNVDELAHGLCLH
ncbi:MAG: isochorismatase family protein [Candidatus Aenigmarchaeota archaeon]|nr:isochorismatase family protein [Candidatus Aenigmarchaeota archaeon]